MLRNLKSFNLPELEEKILTFWKEKGIFEKTLRPNRKGSNGSVFNFWEGPPTANGRPGLHHILARSFKDVILRYKTMSGFTVPRKAGWDTHGLPVELQVEKQLGISSKKEIESYGISEFNKKCKESVWLYKSEWEKLTERIGFWLDLSNPYITYDSKYIETLWWIIQKIHKSGLLYQGHKIVPWCPRCGTSLSSHELALGYKTVSDQSVYISFKIIQSSVSKKLKTKINSKTHILSWTTTPWTLPGNVALAVGKKIKYTIAENIKTKIRYIISSSKVEILGDGYRKLYEINGEDLIGISYAPLFSVESLKNDKSYHIYDADFVTDEDGTGVVHTAVMYGEDDYNLGKKIGLPQFHTVDESGKFTKDVKELYGKFVKDLETEKKIFDLLKKNNNFFKEVPYEHEYPFCWRCSTHLLYYARGSWFIKMSSLKDKLCETNKKINWYPEHVKEGRFGEWLKDVKDWNFSRERYWGTPLPIWKCDGCGNIKSVGSYDELSKLADRKNRYFVIRHGQATSNVDGWLAGGKEGGGKISKLTKEGISQVEKAAQKLKKEKIDIIYSSTYHRAKETAVIISKVTGAKIIFDKRLIDTNFGIFNHKKVTDYWESFKEKIDQIRIAPKNGESLNDVRKRVYELFREIDLKYYKKNILFVSHGDPSRMLFTALKHLNDDEVSQMKSDSFLHFAECKELSYDHLPTDELGIVDPHRPYIDSVQIDCEKCSGVMKRIPEVADVWFDSGSMPFAQNHWPFDGNKKPKLYPADYICEAMDQTRGWFYTLLAVSTVLGLGVPYKNVISVGLIHDKNGQKMSKSKGNVVDPWALIHKYGVDSVRWYFFTLNDPGEAKNFDENDVQRVLRGFLLMVYNSFSFLSIYGKKKISIHSKPTSKNTLDIWILRRLQETINVVIEGMNGFDIMKSSYSLENFANDLSRWYIRRSRKRFQKGDDDKDLKLASEILAYVLLEFSKLLAPFIPFFSDILYQSLKNIYSGISFESVHLEQFPEYKDVDKKDDIQKIMDWGRNISSNVLSKRAEAQIKVRQPLSRLIIKQIPKSKHINGVLDIIKEEINVKEIIQDTAISEDFILDMVITSELKAEGFMRELSRAIQDLRQEAGYVPKDSINLWIYTDEQTKNLIDNNKKTLSKDIGATKILFDKNEKVDARSDTVVDGLKIWIGVKKTSGK